MKLDLRQFAAAGLLLCPLLGGAQELPSAPSAVVAEHGFAQADADITFPAVTAPVTVSSPTRSNAEQKFNIFVEQSTSGYATFSSAIAASFRPAWNNAQYPENYAGRFGQTMTDQTEQGFFTKFLLPSMFHQDPRYYPSDQPSHVNRATYALSRVVVGRDDNGRPTLNTPELLGVAIAASLTTAYHPIRHYTPGETANRAASGIGADAGMNVLREFWPDLRERLLDHGPRLMQSLVTRFAPRTIPGTVISSPSAAAPLPH